MIRDDNGKFVWGGWLKPYQYILQEASPDIVEGYEGTVNAALGKAGMKDGTYRWKGGVLYVEKSQIKRAKAIIGRTKAIHEVPEIRPMDQYSTKEGIEESIGTLGMVMAIRLHKCGQKHRMAIKGAIRDLESFGSKIDPVLFDAKSSLDHLVAALLLHESFIKNDPKMAAEVENHFNKAFYAIRDFISHTKPSEVTLQPQYAAVVKVEKALVAMKNCTKTMRVESVEEADALTEARRAADADHIYFKSFTAALNYARAKAEKRGYEIDEDDWNTRVTHGYPGRPAEGETTNVKIRLLKGGKPVKPMLVVSVYGMKTSFELTSYISESVEVTEAVSANKAFRLNRVNENQARIDRIKAYIQAKGLPLELKDTVGGRLPWLTTYNQRLGTEEYLKQGASAWLNFEGLYVGRELNRIVNVLKHHGIVIPYLESVEIDGSLTENDRMAFFKDSPPMQLKKGKKYALGFILVTVKDGGTPYRSGDYSTNGVSYLVEFPHPADVRNIVKGTLSMEPNGACRLQVGAVTIAQATRGGFGHVIPTEHYDWFFKHYRS